MSEEEIASKAAVFSSSFTSDRGGKPQDTAENSLDPKADTPTVHVAPPAPQT